MLESQAIGNDDSHAGRCCLDNTPPTECAQRSTTTAELLPMDVNFINNLSLPASITEDMNDSLELPGRTPESTKEEEHSTRPLCIFDLPRELIKNILSQLNYHELKSLRRVCKASSELMVLDDIKNARLQLRASLWDVERADYEQGQPTRATLELWARHFPEEYQTYCAADENLRNIHENYVTRVTHLNCYTCLLSLPRACFADRQAMGSRSLGHVNGKKRFCAKCGVERSIWVGGTVFKVGPRTYVFCKACRSIQDGQPRYREHGFCSEECQDLGEQVQPSVSAATDHIFRILPTTNDLVQIMLKETKPVPEININPAPNIRATRCLACWGVDHTEKVADGDLGMHLCKRCEIIKGWKTNEPSRPLSINGMDAGG